MIDYILWHETEAAASADPLLAPWRLELQGWDTSRVLPTVSIYRIAGTVDAELMDGVTIQREVRAPLEGHYMVIALDQRDAALDAAPQTMLIADRSTGVILHTITTLEDLATLHVEPTFAGSAYPFGAPVIAA